MRSTVSCVLGLLLVLALVTAASGAPQTPPVRSLASHLVLTDPAGDNEGGLAPDITGVEIFNDLGGTITLVVNLANRAQLLPEDLILINLDTDRNLGTGLFGSDYVIGYSSDQVVLFFWNGTDLSPLVTQNTLSGTFVGGVLTVTINRSEIGNVDSFGVGVDALHIQGDNILSDVGPVGAYEIDLEPDTDSAPPPRRLAKLKAIKLLANGRVVKVDVKCLPSAQSPCKGTAVITATVARSLLTTTMPAAKTRTVTLGKAKFTIKPNKKKTVKVRLNKTGRKLVTKLRKGQIKKLRVVVKATAQDKRKLKTTDSKRVVLKLPRMKTALGS